MFGRFSTGLVRTLRDLRKGDEAVVAIQVVIFSVALLTSAGLVIDFGRAYSAHTQMQNFVDKAALAAAAELDGGEDAITRATAAAMAVQQNSTFVEGDGAFSIESMTFLVGNPVDSSGDFDAGAVSTLATTTDAFANHVHVKASNETVRLTFLSIDINDADDTGAPETEAFDLSVYAVARMEVSFCGDLSTLVMCNPFEGDSAGFAGQMDNQEGARMLLHVDRSVASGGGYTTTPLSTNDGRIRVGVLSSADDQLGADAGGFCDDTGLQVFQGNAHVDYVGGDGTTARTPTQTDPWTYPTPGTADFERLRDTCLLASIDSQLQCVRGEVLVKPTDPEVVTTALNTLFDIWDAPMDRVLNQPVTAGRAFAPDYVAPNGLFTREEYQDYYAEQVTLAEQDVTDAEADVATAERNLAIVEARFPPGSAIVVQRQAMLDSANATLAAREERVTELQAVAAEYPDTIANAASRRNMMRTSGGETIYGPMYLTGCLDGDSPNCPVHSYIAMANSYSDPADVNSLWQKSDAQPFDTAILPAEAAEVPGEEASGSEEATEAEGSGGEAETESGTTPATYDPRGIVSRGKTQLPDEENGDAMTDVTGWYVYNDTDDDHHGYMAFNLEGSEGDTLYDAHIFVPARSYVELQTPVDQTLYVYFRDGLTVSASVDAAGAYTGIPSPSYDIALDDRLAFAGYFGGVYTNFKIDNSVDPERPSTSLDWDIASAQTLYDGYSLVERPLANADMLQTDAGNSPSYANVRSYPDNYEFTGIGAHAEQTTERRRQNVALVNCQALTSPTNNTSGTYNGSYVAELEGVVSLFFTEQVIVRECDSTIGGDPEDQKDCWNSDIVAADIAVEYLGMADPSDPDVQEYRNYAVLVH
ncbi:TadE/TadG family type IV pilus assembly protein [Roseobacter sp. HKCCA0434]|uniref:TadE/TadG family type IV pilus assembly protein n=1 Tax=Roseobacter sp. HKCCA0434 TaxID=3079297 RepID=UPI002905D919|nr:pilus assembly protein TadG-related protein [Roseobacter sp. HKCCA0434]